MPAQRLLAALLLAAPLLAGCLGDAEPEQAPPSVLATYRYEAGPDEETFEVEASVTEAGPRRDRDGRFHDAYVLRSATASAGRDGTATQALLDGGLRVVRMDQQCFAMDESGCLPWTRIEWEPRFRAPPFGYGWPQLLDRDGALPDAYAGTEAEWAVARSTEGGRVVVSVTVGDRTDRHVYVPGEWLPERIEWDGLALQRTSYREGPPMAAAPRWPDLAPAPVSPAAGALPVADPDRVLLGEELSPRAALDALAEEVPEARAILDAGGCVARYSVSVPPTGGPQPLLPPLRRTVSDHEVILAAADGTLHGWRLSQSVDLLGMRSLEVTSEVPMGADASCLAGPSARTAARGVSDAIAELGVPGRVSWWMAAVEEPWHGKRPPEHGWVTYRIGGWVEPGETGLTEASYDASQGVWNAIAGHGAGFHVDGHG